VATAAKCEGELSLPWWGGETSLMLGGGFDGDGNTERELCLWVRESRH
jgi:hypothetical protein